MPIGTGHMRKVKALEARSYNTEEACGHCSANRDTVEDGKTVPYWQHCDTCASSNKTWGAPDAERCTWMISTDNQGPSKNINPASSQKATSLGSSVEPDAATATPANSQYMLPSQSPATNTEIFKQDECCEPEDMDCLMRGGKVCE